MAICFWHSPSPELSTPTFEQLIRSLFCSQMKGIGLFAAGKKNRMCFQSSWAAGEVYVMSCQRLCESHCREKSRLCSALKSVTPPTSRCARWIISAEKTLVEQLLNFSGLSILALNISTYPYISVSALFSETTGSDCVASYVCSYLYRWITIHCWLCWLLSWQRHLCCSSVHHPIHLWFIKWGLAVLAESLSQLGSIESSLKEQSFCHQL